jgi:multimeric flavodoxin WrbA
MTRKIVGIVGSYRKGGVIDQTVTEILHAAAAGGAATKKVYLIDRHIEFCRNCRTCMQSPGPTRGLCVHQDDMGSILADVDAADALVIGAPVNWYNVTAVTRKFLERLVCYGYWPWGRTLPAYRIKKPAKKAVLVTSCAMPAFMGRLSTGAIRSLKLICRAVGAKPIGSLFIGLAAQQEKPVLAASHAARARKLGAALAA